MTQTATSARHRHPGTLPLPPPHGPAPAPPPSRRSIHRQDPGSGGRQRSARRSPLGRLRDNAALLGTALASAGLIMGAVVPSTAPGTPDGALTAGTAPTPVPEAAVPAPDPAVTAPADAPVGFARESTGPAVDGIAPEVVRARARSGPLPPALAERRAFGSPVEDPVVSSRFGYRVDPLDGNRSDLHTGQDYASACGTAVRAADAGTVVDSGWHAYGGGLRIVVDHGAGLTTTYNHLGTLDVPAGAAVRRGQTVGAVGSSGNSTGCHLHFEVLISDEKVDPQPWL